MKRLAAMCILTIMCCCLLYHTALGQGQWNVVTEELPPYNYAINGVVQGLSTDILLRLFEKEGIVLQRDQIRLIPWPRAYEEALKIPGTVLFSAARTEEREPLFRWVGPITNLTMGLVALKEKHLHINSLDDVSSYTVGTIFNGAPEQFVIKGGVPREKLERVYQPELNIKKLQAGRIDLFAFSVFSAKYLMATMGIDPNNYENVYTLKQVDLYYAFHRRTDAALITSLNAALAEMKQPGSSGVSEVDRIINSYLH